MCTTATATAKTLRNAQTRSAAVLKLRAQNTFYHCRIKGRAVFHTVFRKCAFLPLQISNFSDSYHIQRVIVTSIFYFFQKLSRESIALANICFLASCFDDNGSPVRSSFPFVPNLEASKLGSIRGEPTSSL